LGDYVVSRLWLGKVAEVSLHVDVAFNDGGALCTLTRAEGKLVGPAERPSVSQVSRWIKGDQGHCLQSRRRRRARADVHWIAVVSFTALLQHAAVRLTKSSLMTNHHLLVPMEDD
jgi:hypothetical protein